MIDKIKIEDIKKGRIYYRDNKNRICEFKLKEFIITENSGYFLISGKVRIKDGTVYPAILGISSNDCGELFEAYFYINGKWVPQEDKNFLKLLKRKKKEVFPYKYHLNVKVEGDKNIAHQF